MSVRGLYTPPAEEWVFLPPSVPAPLTSPSPSAPAHLPTPFSSTDDASPEDGRSGLIALFATEFFSTALGQPFEVGKTLLQVEYRPRRRFAPGVGADGPGDEAGAGAVPAPEPEPEAVDEESSSEDEGENGYFTSSRSGGGGGGFTRPPRPSRTRVPVDDAGYFPDLDPSWLLKDDPDISGGNGVWGMIRRIRATPSEGLAALWKGQIISTVHSLLANILQPQLSASLDLLHPHPDLPLVALPQPAIPLGLQVASHLLTHLLLSPLELLRTRTIVMPNLPNTPSSITLFNRMVADSGLAEMYFHPNLLLPALLEHTLRPLLTLSIPILLERQWHISPDLAPITYSLCDLSLNLAALVVLLPIETVRKRLQVQARGTPIRSVVRTRERPYVGIVDGLWRIVTEETGKRRKRVMTERDEGGLLAGIRQLYRGFGMAATAHVTVFSLGLVSASLGGRGFDNGWKEI